MPVIISKKHIFIFTLCFWLIASFVLFIDRYSLALHHMEVASIRHIYLYLIGVCLSSALAKFYHGNYFRNAPKRFALVLLSCGLAAITTALLLNPITYMMVGYSIHQVLLKILTTSTLYFFLLYCFWTALYFQLSKRSMITAEHEISPSSDVDGSEEQEESNVINQVFNVEKLGEKRRLQDFDICCIRAKGDYVELVTENNSYLIKNTLL